MYFNEDKLELEIRKLLTGDDDTACTDVNQLKNSLLVQ
jgi:hypothetical protein